ncbi:hypothetical protein ACFWP5_39765 [Streptomyces sp. NPDC058469]|uniref:hypothetical protein n=1 Tax=Streptomyces sp. NPDC058469 TaxID=3346514 RepID=UPI0036523CD1
MAVAHWRWMGEDGNEAAFSLVDGTALVVVMSGVVLGPVFWAMRWSSTARYRLVLGVIDAIVVGGKARAAPRGRGRSRALRQLDQRCRHVEKRLFKVHSIAGSVPRRSSRLRLIKRHAALVAGAQRVALHQVDVDPEPALAELARLQLVIAENHLYGRQQRSCPPSCSKMSGPCRACGTPGTSRLTSPRRSSRPWLPQPAPRALPSMGVGEDVRPWLILGAAVLAATLVAGWGRVTRILELFPA